MTKKRKKKTAKSNVERAFLAALARVELCKKRIEALHFATQGVRDKFTGESREEFSALHLALFRDLNEAYRTVFMWGVVDPSTRLEAKRMALSHFLKEGVTVMQLFDHDGRHPSGYYVSEKEAFMAEIAQLAKEVEKGR